MNEGAIIPKDPGAALDYYWDFSDWLPDGDPIAGVDLTLEGTLELVGVTSITGGVVRAVLKGGNEHTRPSARCKVTLASGLYDTRTLQFEIRKR